MDSTKYDKHYRKLYSFSEYAELTGYSRNQISVYARRNMIDTLPCFATKRFYVIDSEKNANFIKELDKKRKSRASNTKKKSK
jgi:hypothetical protein